MKTLQVFLLVLISFFFNIAPSHAERPLRVVTTLSTFADLVKTIGGEHVEVSYIASPRFDPHFIEPKPSDVLKVKKCDLFGHAGLDLELWRWPLVEAAGNLEVMPGGKRELDLSKGIQLLEVPTQPVTRAQGDMHLYGNPHYWLDPGNVKTMAETITQRLIELDHNHAEQYQHRLAHFLNELDQKINQWQQKIASIHGKEFIAYHNAWPYLSRFSGTQVKQFLEPKPGIPPTPKQIEFIEQYIRQKNIRAIIAATYDSKRAAHTVADRTGTKVILLCQNVGEVEQATDYISMMEYNIQQLVSIQ